MTALNKQALREAAEKATPGRIGDRIDGSGSIKYECHGYDESLVLRTDHKNMEYGFIGENGNADELFFRLCVPDVILALLDELEAAEKRIADLQVARDKCFLSGLKTGWEYGIADDTEGYNREISDAQAVIDRAAMLQAGNSPVIPDGWIPVSERMPEGMKTVITSNGFDIGQGWWDGEAWTSFDCHDVVPGKVTHWMPLPASPHFREIGNSSTNNFRENAETSTKCWCHTCRPVTMSDMRFVVCPDCGNKRCPRANDHRNACTGSNEPGQIGSAYQAAPQQEVK
ncbi:ead/Ea22-like family protein [Citrobacter sp. Cb041]|uniref:ead/Ea22-like family protein n=1 Tax=Citrobacter sp. Cb041 TaxID=2985028 RepID=UPI00257C2E4B|nr:ead/Ea22-like family protein [Citrobacter sp. Cb041]MDM3469824.1 ead/Ea22-like family protein [Citrobacter sp. Cb041]